MVNTHIPATALMRDWKWAPGEKGIARRAFDLALSRELESVIREAKARAEQMRKASDLWDMEDWLTEQRTRIDRTFDFRYSVLPHVFAALLRDHRLCEDDLRGLAQEKLDAIRHMSS